MLKKIIRFFLENKVITFIIVLLVIVWGIVTAPFDWNIKFLPRDPIAVDAIPNIGANQQIVYTQWAGHSPKDVQDQISYPLTTALLGVPGVKTIRSTSMFGASFVYIIFKDNIDYYWSRARILEKLNSLSPGLLPQNIKPTLGPDATGLGQVFWYTLEGRNPKTGKPEGGWNPEELRTLQDFYVKYALSSAEGVSEVASIGGYVKEYQVNINPNKLRSYGVTIQQVMNAVKNSNKEIGARTMSFNKVEYIVRGLGYIKNLDDLKKAVVAVRNNTPIRVEDVAKVQFGPDERRGGLDKAGVEAVGGVVTARYGSNPMQVIKNVKKKIAAISNGLPSKKLKNGDISKVTIVPFYDRSHLIKETLGTLNSALTHEILISIIVILALLLNLRASFIVSSLLPIGVLATFIIMRYCGVTANIVALSGIVIAIGVMVDVGIVFTENIIQHIELPENRGKKGKELLEIVYQGTIEVAPAIVTAMIITIVSFLPVFGLQGEAGKMFHPLAFTKTFALIASLILGIIAIPAITHFVFGINQPKLKVRNIINISLLPIGIFILIYFQNILGLTLILLGINQTISLFEPHWDKRKQKIANTLIIILTVAWFLAKEWLPLGVQNGLFLNFIFSLVVIAAVLGLLIYITRIYTRILTWSLQHKWKFLSIPIIILFLGILSWIGFDNTFSFIKKGADKINWHIENSVVWKKMSKTFPGLSDQFMPPLNEGSFLLMPSNMAHASIEENIQTISHIDKSVAAIPEVKNVVGKWGHVNSALDPAPTSMYEIIINYKSKYLSDESGHPLRFKINDKGDFILKNDSLFVPGKSSLLDFNTKLLIPDDDGNYFRQWRKSIHSPSDIWENISEAAYMPGITSSPKLQPIQVRQLMLATGMRASMGIKVFGPDLQTIENFGLQLEKQLKNVPQLNPASVFADRNVGKPYLEININRNAISRYGLNIADVQNIIQAAVGGENLTTTIEGRKRFAVRVRYARELRDNPDALKNILIPTKTAAQIPLSEIATITYRRGPQMIKSENTFLTGYVIFDKKGNISDVTAVDAAKKYLNKEIANGIITIPKGVTYEFVGSYKQQQQTEKRLSLLIPLSLLLIFLILYVLFRDTMTSAMVFSGIFVAFAGGFIMLWLYGQSWFLNFSIAGQNIHQLFQMHTIDMSTAVWVGFIALCGICTDDGVIMGTYIKEVFEERKPKNVQEIRNAIITAGNKRVRPAVMTAATAIIALIPVLTSTGKGSDIMIPMSIPLFGGMLIQIITMFVLPVLYAMWKEKSISQKIWKLKK